MKLEAIRPEFVEFMPPNLTEGVVYISMTYATSAHLCACGCGNKVVLPISPAEWELRYDGDSISFAPSVGNWEFPCRSHYVIRRNRILWARKWTPAEIEAGRRRDAADLDVYFAGGTDARDGETSPEPDHPAVALRSLRKYFRRHRDRRRG